MFREIFDGICEGMVISVVLVYCLISLGCKMNQDFDKRIRQIKVEIAMDILKDEACESVESMLDSFGVSLR